MSPASMWILREKLCNDEDLGAFFVKKRWIVTCSCPLSWSTTPQLDDPLRLDHGESKIVPQNSQLFEKCWYVDQEESLNMGNINTV
jgi:hypothetical protein